MCNTLSFSKFRDEIESLNPRPLTRGSTTIETKSEIPTTEANNFDLKFKNFVVMDKELLFIHQ